VCEGGNPLCGLLIGFGGGMLVMGLVLCVLVGIGVGIFFVVHRGTSLPGPAVLAVTLVFTGVIIGGLLLIPVVGELVWWPVGLIGLVLGLLLLPLGFGPPRGIAGMVMVYVFWSAVAVAIYTGYWMLARRREGGSGA